MWGQVSSSCVDFWFSRIIPTRVGTSGWMKTMFSVIQDHPHACGDKEVAVINVSGKPGSSPRVWGQGPNKPCKTPSIRIIPTRVGTSLTDISTTSASRDHPHACGDKFPHLSHRTAKCRIIPTRVGTRYEAEMTRSERKDHPHACGDK